jgi:hypothetical protein
LFFRLFLPFYLFLVVTKMIVVAPKIIGVAPKMIGVVPKTIGVVPKMIGVAPKMIGVVPKTIGVVPKMIGVAPKMIGDVPKMFLGAPKMIGELSSYFFVHVCPLLVYVPAPPARYLARKSPSPSNAVPLKLLEGIAPLNVTLARLAQPPNAIVEMKVTPLPIVTLLRLTHL